LRFFEQENGIYKKTRLKSKDDNSYNKVAKLI